MGQTAPRCANRSSASEYGARCGACCSAFFDESSMSLAELGDDPLDSLYLC
jgi:hypothetical protein